MHQRGSGGILLVKNFILGTCEASETNVPKDGFSGFTLRRLSEELSHTEFWCLEISLMNQLAALKKTETVNS